MSRFFWSTFSDNKFFSTFSDNKFFPLFLIFFIPLFAATVRGQMQGVVYPAGGE
jgi:hypothetical protein